MANEETKIVQTPRGKKSKCTVCGKEFVTNYGLGQHMLIHSNKKPYKCSTCERSFRQSGDKRRHERTHGGKLSCPTCEQRFCTKSLLLSHQRLQHTDQDTYQCEKCGNVYINKYNLQNHALVHHSVENEVVKMYECKNCRKKFPTKSGLWNHEKMLKVPCTKNVDVALKENYAEETTGNVAPLKCWVCEEEPGFKSDLMDQFKPQNMGFRYMCPKCDEKLESANNLGEYFQEYFYLLHQTDE